jgi:hypothetical protein
MGCFTFRAVFFAGAGLALAVRFVAFAAFDGLRALPRAVAAFLFWTFDCFLRLAMIRPLVWLVLRIDARSKDNQPTILRVILRISCA